MKIYHRLDEFPPLPAAVATIGIFDGVHVGHQQLLNALKAQRQTFQCATVVVTFWPHPTLQLATSPKATLRLLNTFEEKAALLEEQGVDCLLKIPFDAEFAKIRARDFVEHVLIDHVGVKHLVVGHDFHFGYKRIGDMKLLQEMGEQHRFTVQVAKANTVQDRVASSTLIRQYLMQGAVAEANRYLGYPYFLTCTVTRDSVTHPPVQCLQLVSPDTPKLIPPPGIYGVNVLYRGTTHVGGKLYISQEPDTAHLAVSLPDFVIPPTERHLRVALMTSRL
ncbi:MAG: riboflavin biosynthesis protein RibF [Bacteroidota bacterium]